MFVPSCEYLVTKMFTGGFFMRKTTRSKKSKEAAPFSVYFKPVGIGIGFAFLTSFILLFILAFVLAKKDLARSIIFPYTFLVLGISSFLSGYIASRILKKNGLILGVCCGVSYYFILLLCTIIFNQSPLSMLSLIKFAVLCITAGLGGMIGVNQSLKHR